MSTYKNFSLHKNRHVGGKKLNFLVEASAVFHSNNNEKLLSTNDEEKKHNQLVCKANFNAFRILLKGTFTEDAIQYV